MTKQEAMSSFHAHLSAKLPGITPEIIIAVIAAVIQVLGLCKQKPETILADSRNGGTVFGKVLLRRELSRQGVPVRDRADVIKAVYDVAAEQQVVDIASFQQCCEEQE